ncbi:MAG: FGGY-family carbohydrate kinase [Gammaproteobacteria bacterium]
MDLGTSACRAIVIDARKEIRAQSSISLPSPLRCGIEVEQAPEVWWQAVRAALRDLFRKIPAENVCAIAIDGTSGTLLLADALGNPLRPALMYNDARAHLEAARIAAIAPQGSAAHGVSGSLAKLLFLQAQNIPHAHYALSQADWISAKFRGRFGVSDEHNCLKLGYDPITDCWPDWLDALNVRRDLLPQVLPAGTPIAKVCAGSVAEFGFNPDAVVVAGTTDSTAAVLATGASLTGEAVTSLGSTLVLKVISERPIFAPQYGVYSHKFGDLWLAGGGSNSGGVVLRQYFSPQQLLEMMPRLRPDQPTGLDYYPLPAHGERFPVNDPEFMPRLSPRPSDDVQFFQAMLEGMARIEQRGYELLKSLGAPYPISLCTTGGGAVNAAWTTIRAQLIGVAMITPDQQDAAYGAALLASRALA